MNSDTLIVVLAGVGGIGILLGFLSLWPARVGLEPHCRGCNYNLTGLELDGPGIRCPECGRDVSARRAIRLGRRVRRRKARIAGLVLFLIGITPLAGVGIAIWRGFDIYAWLPPSWLLAELDSWKRTTVLRAVREIQSRLDVDKWKPADCRRLIDRCMREQDRAELRPKSSVAIIDLLADTSLYPLFTNADMQKIRDAAIAHLSLRVRTRTAVNDPLPYEVRGELRMPVRLDRSRLRLVLKFPDGTEQPETYADLTCRPILKIGEGVANVAGDLVVRLRAELLAAPAPMSMPPTTTSAPSMEEYFAAQLFKRVPRPEREPERILASMELAVPISVAEVEPPDMIRLVSSAAQQASFRKYMVVDLENSITSRGDDVRIFLSLPARTVPVCADLLAIAEAGEIALGSVRADLTTQRVDVITWAHVRLPPRVTVRLRPSKAVARHTLDVYEIWGDEFEISDVRVTEELPSSQPATASRPTAVN